MGQQQSQELINESDLSIPNTTPMTFNGDDRIGLFKNDILIDIIGDLDGTSNFAQDVTLRRIISVTSPNTTYTVSEWEILNKDTVDGIGIYNSATAGIDNSDFETFKMYPNPTNGNKIYFNLTKDVNVNIYNVLGKLVKTEKVDTKNNSIDISNLVKGVYLLKIASQNQIITKKLIKK